MGFHFDFANYFKMIGLAWREKNKAARFYFLAVLLLAVPVVASFHAVCFALDGVLFPGLRKTEVRTPVFVVGHARSGTTLVHRLMSKDEGRFSAFVLYELYFPSLLQKKCIRWVARVDRQWFGGFLQARVTAWEDKHYAAVRQVHKMGLTEPEEDDVVLYYSCASGFWITKMPYMGDLDFYYVDEFPEKRRRRLMKFYRECIRRQLYLNGDDRIHLSKNPLFAGRVEALLEEFPDARIVVPMRNPYETIPSLLKLVQGGWKRLGWERERIDRCLKILAEQSFHTYEHPLAVLEKYPQTPGAVVNYRKLTTDPAATLEELYREIGFEMGEDYRQWLSSQSKRERKHVSGHTYSLDEFGLSAEDIHERLELLFDRFQWDTGEIAKGSAHRKDGSSGTEEDT